VMSVNESGDFKLLTDEGCKCDRCVRMSQHDRLSAVLNRPIIDRTRLEGRYDFTLAWSIESAGGFVTRKGPPPDEIESFGAPVLSDPGLSIFTALPAQLGLRLESGRAPIQMLIVTAAERNPARN